MRHDWRRVADTIEQNIGFYFGSKGTYVRLSDVVDLLRQLEPRDLEDIDAIEVGLHRAAEMARKFF